MTEIATQPAGRLLSSAAELDALLARWQSATAVALDTEFLREKTYYPKLCLLQLCWQGEAVAIDVLAIKERDSLRDFLLDDSRIKILHSARQDLELLLHLWGAVPTPLFDTQVAADLVGIGSQSGYARLVNAVFDVALAKDATRSNWCERPLSQSQLAYAYDDVIWLERLYQHLDAELRERQRQHWLIEEMQLLEQPDLYRANPEIAWQRLRGREHCSARQLTLLQALAAWRERFAMQRDLPRKWVLTDAALLNIAMQEPATIDTLLQAAPQEAKQLQTHATVLLELVERTLALPEDSYLQEPAPARLSAAQKQALNTLEQQVQSYAQAASIDAAIIASRKQLAQIVIQGSAASFSGWRRALLEAVLAKQT